jgi:hypothetical protein
MEADKVLGPAPIRPLYGLPSKDPPYKAPKLFKLMPYKLKFQAITWNSRYNPLQKIVCCNASSTNSQYLHKVPSFCFHHCRRLLLRLLLPHLCFEAWPNYNLPAHWNPREINHEIWHTFCTNLHLFFLLKKKCIQIWIPFNVFELNIEIFNSSCMFQYFYSNGT